MVKKQDDSEVLAANTSGEDKAESKSKAAPKKAAEPAKEQYGNSSGSRLHFEAKSDEPERYVHVPESQQPRR